MDPKGTVFWVQGDSVLGPGGCFLDTLKSLDRDIVCQIVGATYESLSQEQVPEKPSGPDSIN